MLKNKSLADFDCVNDEKLFSELTPEEGAAVSGGLTLRNDTNSPLNIYTFDKFFDVELQFVPAGPGSEKDVSLAAGTAYLLYDKRKGFELDPQLQEVDSDGIYTFVEQDGELIVRLGFQTLIANI